MRKSYRILSMLILCLLASACGEGAFLGSTQPTSTWIAFPAAGGSSPGSANAMTNALPVSPVRGMTQGTNGYPWWNDSVFYEIYVRSFYDTNGDGIGDLNGVIQKLDYLNDGNPDTATDLGIDCIWLMPIFPSPTVHGYHVTDYYAVDPLFGTLEDLGRLLQEAHTRGIRVILDIPFNHTSVEHPWFIASQDSASPYRDWYIWKENNPGYPGYWGQEVWHEFNGDYYYGNISRWGPDLNLENPEVVNEISKITRFWLEEVGLDGFRLDSAKHMIEEGTKQANTDSTHAFWKNYRSVYKQINPQAVMLPEIWEDSDITAAYVMGDELDVGMDFYLAEFLVQSVEEENSDKLIAQIEFSTSMMSQLQLGVFLTNHDQTRAMTRIGSQKERAKVSASILLSAPGVPILYYGEEVGLEGVVEGDQNRLPMQWTDEPNAGFSTTAPWSAPGAGWEVNNVANEVEDPGSILAHYQALIQARSQHEALRVGDFHVLETNNPGLYAILRVSANEAVVVLINMSGRSISDFDLSLAESALAQGEYSAAMILGQQAWETLVVNGSGGFGKYAPFGTIAPYATWIVQLKCQ